MQFVQSSIDDIPLGRPGTVDGTAMAVLFLISDDTNYVTGIELFVDGGLVRYNQGYAQNRECDAKGRRSFEK